MPARTEEEYKDIYRHYHDILSKIGLPMPFSNQILHISLKRTILPIVTLSWTGFLNMVSQLTRHSCETLVFKSISWCLESEGL
jgi:hypothetical protein